MTGLIWQREFIRYKRGAIAIMVGRPRKIGKRQPNGQLARTYVSPKAQVAAQPHRIVVPVRFREWPEAESEIGRLMLNGKLTPAQHEAGRRYAELAARNRAAWNLPPIHPTGMDLLRSGGRGGDLPPHVVKAIRSEYDEAFCACAPHKVQRAIAHHVVYERKIDDFATLGLIRDGLDKLIHHFGIDPRLPLDRKRQITESRI